MSNDGDSPRVGGDGSSEDAAFVADINEYLQYRRAFLMARRDSAETEFGKAKFIGALQAVNEFEAMLRQIRVVPTPRGQQACDINAVPANFEELGAQWLARYKLPKVSLGDFRDNAWQNKMIATYPEKREGITLLGALARNQPLVTAILNHLRENLGGAPAALPNEFASPAGTAPATPKCPFCGKSYKYTKALESHKKTCPKNPDLGR